MVRYFFTLMIAVGMCNISLAQATYEITSSKMTITGTSNVHEWESNVTQLTASADIMLEGNVLKAIKTLSVEIPVKGIKSAKGSIMDKKTWGALKQESNPTITYKLTKITALDKNGDNYTIKASGNLNIAGTSKAIEMEVKGKLLSDGSLQFDGAKKILMTDFGIDPPTALMGTMKTGNEVTISFSVKMVKGNGNSKSVGK
ncbi:MAG: YceI family protein [Saprospiraceae bacterium]|nr:YceI family protein [Saprospiraceae bacterium]